MPGGSDATRRQRLDQIVVSRGLASTRSRAQALILAGRVLSDGARLEKPGVRYLPDLPLEVAEGRRYVSRGGHKLQSALDAFTIPPGRGGALDVGASTGGFTQVLLEHGFERVIAEDSGVTVIEGINARYLEPSTLRYRPDLATIDVAFISLELVLPPVVAALAPGGELIALIKPQFEVGRGQVGKGGIVRDPEQHRAVLERVVEFAGRQGWNVAGILRCPLAGAEGNREFLMHVRPADLALAPAAAAKWVARALSGEEIS